MQWFNVDRAGLAAVLERKGKTFALFELVQNAWDSGASKVAVTLEPVAGQPLAVLTVEDNSPDGWADLEHAFTMFARSSRGNDPCKRGRFNLGEKLVLACCREATIETMAGTLVFDEKGRHQSKARREAGTKFTATIRMTREELERVTDDAQQLIPPVPTTFNGLPIVVSKVMTSFKVSLPTEVADETGTLRRSMRQTTVDAYPGDESGGILEMGIPVCKADWPWRLNVHQKIPQGLERDTVTDAFRRALQVAAVSALAPTLDEEQAAAPWASEALGDSRIAPEAVKEVIVKRFGDRAVVAVPGDPMANAKAEAAGYTVVHGGALSGDAWANVRKHGTMVPTSLAFPTPKPEDRAAAAQADAGNCPVCGQKMPAPG